MNGLEEASQVARQLFARYAHAVDTSDADAVAACFDVNATASWENGKFRFYGRAAIHDFFAGQTPSPSTHLIGNILADDHGGIIHARGSALVCVTRSPGFVTFRGVIYQIEIRHSSTGAPYIFSLTHSPTWQSAAPGGPMQNV